MDACISVVTGTYQPLGLGRPSEVFKLFGWELVSLTLEQGFPGGKEALVHCDSVFTATLHSPPTGAGQVPEQPTAQVWDLH